MPKRTKDRKVAIEVPAHLEEAVRRLMAVDELGEKMADGRVPLDSRVFSAAAETAANVGELAVQRRLLQRLDERAKAITIDGKKYRRVGRYEGTYYTKAGPVTLMRTLYRDASVRP